jgi:hypothetical protein
MSPIRDWKTRRRILKPKGISKQAEKVSAKGGGRRVHENARAEGGMLKR